MLNRSERVIINAARGMYYRLREIKEFLLVDRALAAREITGNRAHHSVLDEAGVEQVNGRLRIAAEINVAVAAGRALNREERVEYVRVHTVIVKTAHSPLGVILGSIKNNVAHKFAILKRLSALDILVIIHVNDRVLVLGRYVIVVKELGADEGLSLKLALKLGVTPLEHVLVVSLGMEDVTAALNVGNARLPIDIEKVDALNGYITEPAKLRLVPNDLVNARSRLDLLPHNIGIGVLKAVLLEYARNDRRKHTRLATVATLTRQNVRLGVSLHSVSVL